MHKAKHIAWYYNLFPRINPSFSYCNRVSLFSVTHYISITYKPLPIFQHLYYFAKPILFHCSIICPYHSHCLLFVLCLSLRRFSSPSLRKSVRAEYVRGGGYLCLFYICPCNSHCLLFIIDPL